MAKKRQARSASGRFVKKGRSNSYYQAGRVTQANKPRRKKRRTTAVRAYKARRRSVRNPKLLGFEMPPVKEIVFSGVGFIAPPMLEGLLARTLPISTTGNFMKYAVRIGSVLALSWITRQAVGSRESRAVLIGGSVYVVTTALADFAPGLLSTMYGTNGNGTVQRYVAPNAAPRPRALPSARASLRSYVPMIGNRVKGTSAVHRLNRF